MWHRVMGWRRDLVIDFAVSVGEVGEVGTDLLLCVEVDVGLGSKIEEGILCLRVRWGGDWDNY